jgi:glucose 1-dehydrogenase/3-oxoacyl-[acyl-carrier protein] reductase
MTMWIREVPNVREMVLGQISLARSGECREIGAAVAFFASDEASYITGQSIHADGGWEGK